MDHKEFSSGGPEFSPVPGEFSSAREFSQLAPEFTPAPPEIDRSGSEFHGDSTSAPEKKKKRRRTISPLMLTTAAVMVAAVAVLPFSSKPSGRPIWGLPNMELSAQSKAYLDEVWNALPEGDPELLAALGTDERLRSMAENEVEPYLSMLGHNDRPLIETWADTTRVNYFYGHILSYDGQNAGLHIIEAPAEGGSMDFHYYEYVETQYPDDLHTSAYFQYRESADEDGYNGSHAAVSRGIAHHHSAEGYYRNDHLLVSYEKGRFTPVAPEIPDDRLDEGILYVESWITDPETGALISHDRYTAKGDFALTVTRREEEGQTITEICHYPYNASIIIYREGEFYPGNPFLFQAEVVDGFLQLPEGALLEYYEPTDHYSLNVEYYDPERGEVLITAVTQSDSGLTEDEVLDIRNWHFDYLISRSSHTSER